MTTQTYKTNLNCGSCVAAVKPHLDNDHAIRRWSVDTLDPRKLLTIEGEGITQEQVEHHVAEAGFKVLGRVEDSITTNATTPATEGKSLLVTYWPVMLVFAYLIGLTTIGEYTAGQLDWMRAMANFMGGFFVTFSFFKLLDLRGFVDSFQSYDVVASRCVPTVTFTRSSSCC